MKVKSESEVAQSCPTPSDRMDCSLPGSSVHGICQARVLEWGAIASSQEQLSRFVIAFIVILTGVREKEMATHASVLAWRIPGMAEPGGLPSMGSQRVGHD